MHFPALFRAFSRPHLTQFCNCAIVSLLKCCGGVFPIAVVTPIWKRIEVVITAPTRNRVIQRWVRGFESHRFRQLSPHVLIQSMRTSFCIYRPINRQNTGYNHQIWAMDARSGILGVILSDGGFHFPALFSLIIPIFRGRNQRFIKKCTLLWTIAGYRPQCEVSSKVS